MKACFIFPFVREQIEFLKGIFALAVCNKEADSFDVQIDGLMTVYPTVDKEQISHAVSVFDPEKNSKLTVRFRHRHLVVREYEFHLNQPAKEESSPESPAWKEESSEAGPGERPELNLYERTVQAGEEAAFLIGAAIGAMDRLHALAVSAAELAEVRGQLLDVYEQRLAAQQQLIDTYRVNFGNAFSDKPKMVRTFNGPHCAGIIFNKAQLQKTFSPVMELIRFLMGQAAGESRKK